MVFCYIKQSRIKRNATMCSKAVLKLSRMRHAAILTSLGQK